MAGDSDSYLRIAEEVLARVKTPLSTKQIIRAAYLHGLVPRHLHGSTPHKTLGARLSEDILKLRQRSRFFRNKPGRFFLRRFIRDKSLPLDYRTPIVARRRKRDLKTTNIAGIALTDVKALMRGSGDFLSPTAFAEAIETGLVTYQGLRDHDEHWAPIHSYVIISRQERTLVHTKGRYSEPRGSFVDRVMVGFPVPLAHDDMTLFDIENHGIISAGLTAVAIDLDLEFSAEFPHFEQEAHFVGMTLVETDGAQSLIGVVGVEAPEAFEPSGRRLAVSNLNWLDLSSRTRSHFDPWSKHLMNSNIVRYARRPGEAVSDHA